MRATARGLCPLDGFPLVEAAAHPLVPGGWEHVIPASEMGDHAAVLARIAEAHAFEPVAEAEQALRP